MPQHTPFHSELAPLSCEEYEDIYRETLICLAEQASVGNPFVDSNGYRKCMIDGIPLNDDEILRRWWGNEIGNDIRRLYSVGSVLIQ